MTKNSIVFVGLDTHKEFIEVASLEDGFQGKATQHGRISTAKLSIKKLIRQFESKFPNATLHFVYEAGPCGYWIYRLITSLGHPCYVVAPSLIPKKPSDKVKTDKRDALKLAYAVKNCDVSPIYVPEPEDEAVRDLSRIREIAMRDLNDARRQLKALLLRNNINYPGTANWSAKHLRWLAELVLPHPAQHIVLQESLNTINERVARLERLDNQLAHHIMQWRYFPVVKAVQAMRGVALLVAAGMVAELGDITRFEHPRQLMSFLGLVPSEHSSGGKRKLGSITKTGNVRARRLLIEGAQSYRHPANVSKEHQLRQEGLPKIVIDTAWKAQLRLCHRYQRLMQQGKHHNVIKVAIAREMAAYMWAIAKQIVLPAVDIRKRLARVPA